MRTTLDIDDNILAAIRELAQREGKSAGAVLSDLARRALTAGAPRPTEGNCEPPAAYGFRPLPAGKDLVSNDLVDRLRDEHGV
jgi:hypothetical protein